MTIKEVPYSDFSGRQLAEDDAARLVVTDHPALDGRSVELDADLAEAKKIEGAQLATTTVEVYLPGEISGRQVVVDAQVFDEMFAKGTNVADVLRAARPSGTPDVPKRLTGSRDSAAGMGRSRQGSVNYSSPEFGGQLHRGRVTETEARWVRDNRDLASKNRVAQGHAPIDWEASKERHRYGL